jgi:hypothetical protein
MNKINILMLSHCENVCYFLIQFKDFLFTVEEIREKYIRKTVSILM